MHGGAHGSGAPTGSRNGNYKQGRYTGEMVAARRWLRDATRMLHELNKSTRAGANVFQNNAKVARIRVATARDCRRCHKHGAFSNENAISEN
jgi:hypothetical protein